MPRLPYLVIADDLTGAAELAALAHQAGLRAVVLTEAPRRPIAAEVIVCDSGSRLDAPAVAARKVRQLATQLAALPNAGLFKKVDSVLRGNVVAEIEACQSALGLERALLVPCNPSLGRIINNGRYFVAGQPLDRTEFRRDPHHPRTSSVVTKLLAGTEGCYHTADQLPEYGIVVGEASSPADVSLWASRLDSMLPAGGADFFRMWLMHQRAGRRAAAARPPSARAHLMLSGTATPSDPVTPLPGTALRLDPTALPTPGDLAKLATQQLRAAGTMSIYLDRPSQKRKASPAAINRTFSQLVRRLARTKSFDHVLLTGGTTASCVFAELDWHRFEVVHVWGPGVVTLRPADASRLLVTVKPGSYPWPVSMRRHFAAAT
jgi:uncharacterized protein YgbK (DUF1537 family)